MSKQVKVFIRESDYKISPDLILKTNKNNFFEIKDVDGLAVAMIFQQNIHYNNGYDWVTLYPQIVIGSLESLFFAEKGLREKLEESGYLFITDEQANLL